VTLTPTADAESELTAFDGEGCAAAAPCSVVMDRDRTVTVNFARTYLLTLERRGNGFGVVTTDNGLTCGTTCSGRVRVGSVIEVKGEPAVGASHVWTAGCTGAATCTLTIDRDTTVVAEFTVNRPQLAVGSGHSCLLRESGALRCWGQSTAGQLGYGDRDAIGDDETPASKGDVPLGVDVVQVAAGGIHTCVLDSNGAVRCWGENAFGQLGQGHRGTVGDRPGSLPSSAPNVSLGGQALEIVLGGWHTCARLDTGAVRCWGRNDSGQLGYGHTMPVADGTNGLVSPAVAGDVPLGGRAIALGAGASHTCAVLESHEVYCWGDNSTGQLGYPLAVNVGDGNATAPTPQSAGPIGLEEEDFVAVVGGFGHTCVRTAQGSVRCWGDARLGQLGNGSDQQIGGASGRPIAEASVVQLGGMNAAEISSFIDHTCARSPLGRVRCWGVGEFGQLGYDATTNVGDGTGDDPDEDVVLGANYFVDQVAAGARHSCALMRVGASLANPAVACWGWGQNGNLGYGNMENVGDGVGPSPGAEVPVF
jgi:alpha-tubulin suppressor-like RCC1 family protein